MAITLNAVPVIPQPKVGVILHLTDSQAISLRKVVGSVGGTGLHRENIDAIWMAFEKAGFREALGRTDGIYLPT